MLEKIRKAKSYEKANTRAQDYAQDPEKLNDLIGKASKKAQKKNSGPLAELKDSLATVLRMLKAYAGKEYSAIPWQTLLMLIGSVVYFAMPVDMIPDFLAGLGLVDDITLLGYTIKSAKADIVNFEQWEAERDNPLEPETQAEAQTEAKDPGAADPSV